MKYRNSAMSVYFRHRTKGKTLLVVTYMVLKLTQIEYAVRIVAINLMKGTCRCSVFWKLSMRYVTPRVYQHHLLIAMWSIIDCHVNDACREMWSNAMAVHNRQPRTEEWVVKTTMWSYGNHGRVFLLWSERIDRAFVQLECDGMCCWIMSSWIFLLKKVVARRKR